MAAPASILPCGTSHVSIYTASPWNSVLFPGLETAKRADPDELIRRENEPRTPVKEVLKIISVLPADAQIGFAYICYSCGNENKNGPIEAEGDLIDWLIDAGLLKRIPSAANCLRYMRKDLILDLYGEAYGLDKKMKKSEIVDILLKEISYYDIPKEHRRGQVVLDSKIDRDASRLHRRIMAMYPREEDDDFY